MTEARSVKTERLTHSTRGPAVAAVKLVILEGEGTGKSFLLEQGTALLGTSSRCDLVLVDSAASRRHAQVELWGNGVRVRDLGSTNGTRFMGARVETLTVPLGSSVTLGRTRVGFFSAVEGAPTELPPDVAPALDDLVGISLAMRRLFADVLRVAASDMQVLLEGETGTGKELVARAIHARSERRARELVIVDCHGLLGDMAQSTLFGHMKGSFTGAAREHEGMVERATGGTLLLDGVGELPAELQSTLLRVLETGQYQRLGDTRMRHADFRLLATSQGSLRAQVEAGTFRSDLFYRVAAVTLTVPPLRERLDDLPALVERFAREVTGASFELRPEVLGALISHAWPGNVRELRNVVARSVALGQGPQLPGMSGLGLDADASYYASRDRALDAFERSYLVSLLEREGGVASAAARTAKVPRSYFYRLLTKHGLKGEKDGG